MVNPNVEVPLTELSLPEVIEIEPTHTCNLRCVMCHVSYEKLTHTMIRSDFVERLRSLKGKWAVVGSNYEPAAHPKFVDLMLGLSELGMKIELTTNGTLFTTQVSDRVADCHFENITVSFDGIRKETYEFIRRNANYDRAIERILYFKNSVQDKKTYFTINNTLMKRNIDEVAEAVDFWEKYGFDHMGFIIMVLRDKNPALLAESLEPMMNHAYKRLETVARRVIEKKYKMTLSSPMFARMFDLKKQYPLNFPSGVVQSDHAEARTPFNPRTYFQNGNYPGMHVECRSPFKFARISYNGDVELCYQFKIGNIYQDDFVDIWYGEKAKKVRELVLQSAKVCHACDYYHFCVKAGEVDYSSHENYYSNVSSFSEQHHHRQPTFIENCGFYNIVGWLGKYYGVPKYLGLIDVRFEDEVNSIGVFSASSIEKLKKVMSRPEIVEDRRNAPLVIEDNGFYNVVRWGDKYYGIPKHLGSMDIRFAEDTKDIFVEDSIEELKKTMSRPEVVEDSRNIPWFVEESDLYNVIRWTNKYYGIPKYLGAVDIRSKDEANSIGVFSALSIEELKKIMSCPEVVEDRRNAPLVLEDCGFYNIVHWAGKYYGVPKHLGSIDVRHAGQATDIFVEDSIEKLKKVMSRPEIVEDRRNAPLVLEDCGFYNVVRWGDKYYGIPKHLGSVDIRFTANLEGVFVDSSVEGVKKAMNQPAALESQQGRPIFMEDHGSYKIVKWRSKYYGLPRFLGPVDIRLVDTTKLKGVFIGSSLEHLKQTIDLHYV